MGKVRYCVLSQDMAEDISIRGADEIIETLIEMYPFLVYHSITFMSTYMEVYFEVDDRERQQFKLLGRMHQPVQYMRISDHPRVFRISHNGMEE